MIIQTTWCRFLFQGLRHFFPCAFACPPKGGHCPGAWRPENLSFVLWCSRGSESSGPRRAGLNFRFHHKMAWSLLPDSDALRSLVSQSEVRVTGLLCGITRHGVLLYTSLELQRAECFRILHSGRSFDFVINRDLLRTLTLCFPSEVNRYTKNRLLYFVK